MHAWLARLLNRLIAALQRVRTRLEPAGGDVDTPPPHWLAHVAERAPHLVVDGRVRSTFASSRATSPPTATPPLPGMPASEGAPLPPGAAPLLPPSYQSTPEPPLPQPAGLGWRQASFDRLAAGRTATPLPPTSPTPPDLDLAFASESHWPSLDATAFPPGSVHQQMPGLDLGDQPTVGWPELPPMGAAETRADGLDPLLESEFRRLERSLREMEGLPWIG